MTRDDGVESNQLILETFAFTTEGESTALDRVNKLGVADAGIACKPVTLEELYHDLKKRKV